MRVENKHMTNILYVSPFSHIGGGEVSLLTVINNLDRARFSPSLVCYEDGPFIERAKNAGIKVIVFRRSGLISEFSIVRKLASYIRANDIRIVHVNSLDIRAGIAAWLAGVPSIGHLRVTFPFTWRDRFFVRLSVAIIAVSGSVADGFLKNSPAYRSKFVIIPNAVDLPHEVRPAPLRKEFGIPNDAPLVGITGRMDPIKGYGVFIDAAAIVRKSVPAARFVIISAPAHGHQEEERYAESLKRQALSAGLGDSCIFAGFRDDVLNALAALSVLVVPSVTVRKGRGIAFEGFGRVAVEAMAVGVPVVSSGSGGLKEIVEDGVSGVIVPEGDAAATAAAVIELLRDPGKANAIRMAAKNRFDARYSLKSIAALGDLYDRILKK